MRKNIQISLREDVLRDLDRLAEELGFSRSAMITHLIQVYKEKEKMIAVRRKLIF